MSIPPTIHQFWCGDEMPNRYKEYSMEVKRIHPSFRHFFWTQENFNSIIFPSPILKHLLNPNLNPAIKSDIVRHYLLWSIGGIWLDTDCDPVLSLTPLLDYDYFTAFESASAIGLAVIGSVPHHPVSMRCLDTILMNLTKNPHPQSASDHMKISAPYALTHQYLISDRITYLPSEFFYPIPWDKWDTPREVVIRMFPECFMIHRWAGARPDGWTNQYASKIS